MAFKNRNFSEPTYEEEEREPKQAIIISCEGRNTEPEYFKTIKSKLSREISVLLEVEIVPKNDNSSNPKHIIENLEVFIDKYDYKSDHDEMWLVMDREKVDDRKKHILDIIPTCKEKNYYIALTNPLFEFWLLLHIVDISEYNSTKLYENKKINSKSKRRFIDKELSRKLENGFNKKKDKFNKSIVTRNNINRAISQEEIFANNVEEIIDKLGSNIGTLVSRFFKE